MGATIRRVREACSIISRADGQAGNCGRHNSLRIAAPLRSDLAVAADAGRRAARRLLAASGAATGDATSELVPLHKLSQWLAYSLIEPLQWGGISVSDIDGLTGLAEYRNGGLFVDTGVLAFRDPADAARQHDVAAPLVVEWRALTVALLDKLADAMRRRLKLDEKSLPLAKVLEGGTWSAGRIIASKLRRRLAADQSHQRRHGVLRVGLGRESCKASPSSTIRWSSTS